MFYSQISYPYIFKIKSLQSLSIVSNHLLLRNGERQPTPMLYDLRYYIFLSRISTNSYKQLIALMMNSIIIYLVLFSLQFK